MYDQVLYEAVGGGYISLRIMKRKHWALHRVPLKSIHPN